MVSLCQQGWTYQARAEATGFSRTGRFNICQRYAREGVSGFNDSPKRAQGRRASCAFGTAGSPAPPAHYRQEAGRAEAGPLPCGTGQQHPDWFEVEWLPAYAPDTKPPKIDLASRWRQLLLCCSSGCSIRRAAALFCGSLQLILLIQVRLPSG